MSKPLNFHNEFLEFIDEANRFICFTVSEKLQKEKILECDIFIRKIKVLKLKQTETSNELAANDLFHRQCFINSIKSALLMFVELKNGNFYKSWNSLIDATDYAKFSLKVNDYTGIRNLEFRLEEFRNTLFPHFSWYLSRGTIETIGNCSICEHNFFECTHIENEVYMGKLCRRLNIKIKSLNHVGLVDNPEDKRCIINILTDKNGVSFDQFTFDKKYEVDVGDSYSFTGITLSFSKLDLD